MEIKFPLTWSGNKKNTEDHDHNFIHIPVTLYSTGRIQQLKEDQNYIFTYILLTQLKNCKKLH